MTSIHRLPSPSLFAGLILAVLPLSGSGGELYGQDQPADAVQVWAGTIDAGVAKLRVEFHLTTADDGSTSVEMVSLDQGNVRMKADSFARNDGAMEIKFKQVAGTFRGKLNSAGDRCDGTWTQSATEFPLTLERKAMGASGPAVKATTWEDRPQVPKAPFPYSSEDVDFLNQADDVRLAGTLTIPKSDSPVPAVVLVSGSGPQDRDESLMAHKPFLVLADFLGRQGIAVLRYDDRGVGESMGDFAKSTTMDFSKDAQAAVDFLAQHDGIDPQRIGILGHSEGGLIAPMVANRSDKVSFVILMAGPGVDGAKIIVSQSRAMTERMGASETDIEHSMALTEKLMKVIQQSQKDENIIPGLEASFDEWVKTLPEAEQPIAQAAKGQIQPMATPWFRFFVGYDPRPALEQLKCRTLVLQGERDLQVLAEINLPPIREALSANRVAGNEVVLFPGMNHLFQSCETGLPGEYVKIDETINPSVLEKIATWIKQP